MGVSEQNSVFLCGRVSAAAEFSHENLGESYYGFKMSVKRLSDAEDVLNIIAPRAMCQAAQLTEGSVVCVNGELRTYNKKTDGGSKLIITVYAKEILHEAGEEKNEIKLTGSLCKQPVYRKTPLGREICDMMIAVNRRYNRADYLPCIAWGKNAKICGQFDVGDKVIITGRVQSRDYIKTTAAGEEVRTAYEISVSDIEKTG